MPLGDRFYRKAREKLEARINEPVEVLGWASRPGAMGAVIAGVGAPGRRMDAAGGGKGARLPMSFLVALTPSAMRVFKFRKTWTGLKIKQEVGALPREGLHLAIEDGAVMKRFSLHGTDGSSLNFEMTKSTFASTFADDLTRALTP